MLPELQSKKRITALDFIIISLMLLAGYVLIMRMQVGLHYRWNWQAVPQYLIRFDSQTNSWVPNLLIHGLLTTIRLSFWATILATLIGIGMALLRISSRLFHRLIAGTYVELVRNLPPLVLMFIFYYFLGDQILPFIGLDQVIAGIPSGMQDWFARLFAPPSFANAFLSALIALAIFEGAYITEIIRAGIQSIERGQWEASSALGFTWSQQMRYVILPQAIQRILPPLAGQFISTIKDSAIVSVISIQELTFQGMELMASTYMTFEIWITITILYLSLTLSCSLIIDRFERLFVSRHV